MFDEKLARVLNFTEEDLTANRQGYMTKTQRKRLRKEVMSTPVELIVPLLILLLLYVCAVVLNITTEGQVNGQLLICGFLQLFGMLTIVALYTWTRRKVNADLRKGDVAMVEGSVVAEARDSGGFNLVMGGLAFPIPFMITTVLNFESMYRVYYAPHTKYILSAERMQDKA